MSWLIRQGYTGQPSPKFKELRFGVGGLHGGQFRRCREGAMWNFKTQKRRCCGDSNSTYFAFQILSGSSDAQSVSCRFQNIQKKTKKRFWEHVHATQPIVQNIHCTLNRHTPARGPIRSVGRLIVFLSIYVYTVLMFILLLCCFILTFTLFYRLYIRIIRGFVNRRRKGFSGSSANRKCMQICEVNN